jgi:hypothetical protein
MLASSSVQPAVASLFPCTWGSSSAPGCQPALRRRQHDGWKKYDSSAYAAQRRKKGESFAASKLKHSHGSASDDEDGILMDWIFRFIHCVRQPATRFIYIRLCAPGLGVCSAISISFRRVAKRRTQSNTNIIAAVMDQLPRNDEGRGFERLLGQLDDEHDQDFNGWVRFGRLGRRGVLSDHGAQRLGQSLLGAVHRRGFHSIYISPYYMTADADQYSELLEFLASGQYCHVGLYQDAAWPAPQPGMLAAMEHVLAAMNTNQEPALALLEIIGVSLTLPILHLALQCVGLRLTRCRMESPLLQQILPNDTADRDVSPERGTTLNLLASNDWFGILQAATNSRPT